MDYPLTGGCTCGEVRYDMCRPAMFVHGCHCTWCQRETGSAFAINALIEASEIKITQGQVRLVTIPSLSGAGQVFARCPTCQVALWSHYGAAKDKICFLRVATLDEAGLVSPDIHIYTSTQRSFITLNDGKPAVAEYYRRSDYWPSESLARYKAALS